MALQPFGGGRGGITDRFLACFMVPRPLTVQVKPTKKADRRDCDAVNNQKSFAADSVRRYNREFSN